jgi:hypothetical protein
MSNGIRGMVVAGIVLLLAGAIGVLVHGREFDVPPPSSRPTSGNRIHGVVLGDGGKVLPSAPVLLTDRFGGYGAVLARTRADSQGRFSFTAKAGEYGIAVLTDTSKEPAVEDLSEFMTKNPERVATRLGVHPSDRELRIFVMGLRARFRFLDSATRTAIPLKELSVRVFPLGGGPGSEDAVGQSATHDPPETGDIWIDVRRTGTYACETTVPGYEAEHPKTVEIGEERESVVEVLLRAK